MHLPCVYVHFQDVTETDWYKKHFAASSCLEIETKHSLEVINEYCYFTLIYKYPSLRLNWINRYTQVFAVVILIKFSVKKW